MKILFFIPSLNNGGAQKQLILNYLSFKQNNHDVKILTLYKDNKNPYLNLIEEGDILTLNKKRGKIYNLFILKDLSRIINSYEIVHTYLAHTLYLCSLSKLFYSLNVLLVGGLRTSVKVSDSIYVYFWNLFNRLIFHCINRFKLVDIFITPSEVTKSSLLKWEKTIPIVVVKNMFLEIDSKPIISNGSGFKFISSGRICDQKDQVFLINAFNSLNSVNDSLSIYGSREDLNYFNLIESLLSKFNNHNIAYCGTYDEPAESFFYNFDALILTSKYEGFPNVVIEALSVGIPVLMPKGLIDSEAILSLVYLYNPGDYVSFLESFYELRGDLKNGSTRNVKNFKNLSNEFSTLSDSYELHSSIYQSILINEKSK